MSELPEQTVRLQKHLARAGVGSRRHCETLIAEGRVTVNGQTVTVLGTKVDPAHDVITVDGILVVAEKSSVYIMLNKPRGYKSAMSDDRGIPCVSALVPIDRYPSLFHVGRLDTDTTGLLLFSTDGDFGNAMLHPSHHVDKRYEALVDGIVTEEEADLLRSGIMLADGKGGTSMTAPAVVELGPVHEDRYGRGPRSEVTVIIHEGRHRQVRHMLRAVGHHVVKLNRTAFGPLSLGDLREGTWRMLTDTEVEALYRASGAQR